MEPVTDHTIRNPPYSLWNDSFKWILCWMQTKTILTPMPTLPHASPLPLLYSLRPSGHTPGSWLPMFRVMVYFECLSLSSALFSLTSPVVSLMVKISDGQSHHNREKSVKRVAHTTQHTCVHHTTHVHHTRHTCTPHNMIQWNTLITNSSITNFLI